MDTVGSGAGVKVRWSPVATRSEVRLIGTVPVSMSDLGDITSAVGFVTTALPAELSTSMRAPPSSVGSSSSPPCCVLKHGARLCPSVELPRVGQTVTFLTKSHVGPPPTEQDLGGSHPNLRQIAARGIR